MINEKEIFSKIEEAEGVLDRYKSLLSQIESDESETNRMIVHELKRPIQNIQSSIEMVKEDPQEFQYFRETIEEGISEAKKLFPITNIYKLSKKEINSQRKNIGLSKMVFNKASLYKNYLKNKSINIYYNPPEEYFLHPQITNFMLGTAIGNSIKWAPKGTSIDIFIEKENDYANIIFENLKGKEPDEEDIGMNLGLGKEIIKSSLEKMGGFQREYSFPRAMNKYKGIQRIGNITNPKSPLDKEISGFYGVEILIPSEKGLISKL